MDETAQVERARRGDISAYEELVRRYQEPAFRTAYLITGGAAEAEDVVQEALIKAYHALPGFRSGAPLRPWLLRIVANEALNHRKAEHRRAALSLRLMADRRPIRVTPSAEAVALATERHALLLQAVDALREEDRLVIAYRYFLGLSEAEMADALDCARGTVKSRLARALARLRKYLAEAPFGMELDASGEGRTGG